MREAEEKYKNQTKRQRFSENVSSICYMYSEM